MYIATAVVFLLAVAPFVHALTFHLIRNMHCPVITLSIILSMAWVLSYMDAFLLAVLTTISWGFLLFARPCMRFKQAMRPPSKLHHLAFATREEKEKEKEQSEESDDDSQTSIRQCTPPTTPRSLPSTPMKPKQVESSLLRPRSPPAEWDEDLRNLLELAGRSGVPE